MDVFSALADPTRREIVAMLAAGERNAGDIAGRFDMAAPSVSRHLKVLRESGVVSYRQDAQARIYRLEPEGLRQAERWMARQLAILEARFDALGAHLDRMKERGD
ncbi:MAG TPA: metalloregulator ArsR/SmtB family transcription factor [Caulobacteraceae bacterium]|jgi:DNA-binding transcriptional ArsR family regulator|nr:metalloregulator ArsR/SmtB family transcription factor [Caulobacteraceae bacterium]